MRFSGKALTPSEVIKLVQAKPVWVFFFCVMSSIFMSNISIGFGYWMQFLYLVKHIDYVVDYLFWYLHFKFSETLYFKKSLIFF